MSYTIIHNLAKWSKEKMSHWSGGLAEWIEGDTAFVSVAFFVESQ